MKSFKLKAYGQTWKVRVLKKHKLLKDPITKEESFGHTDTPNNQILIDSTATEDQQRSTLIHEFIELISFQNDLDLPEQTIKILEGGLYQILHDNNLRF